MTDYKKPPVSPEEMEAIETLHERAEADHKFFEDNVWATTAHAHRGSLIEQLNYTAAVIISIQLELARIKDLLKYAQRGPGEA